MDCVCACGRREDEAGVEDVDVDVEAGGGMAECVSEGEGCDGGLNGARRMRRQISERGGMVKRTTVSDTGLRLSALSGVGGFGAWVGSGGGESHGFPETVSLMRRMLSISAGSQRSLFCARLSSCRALSCAI